MAITGADLKLLWLRKVNAAYSQAYSDTQLSALLNEALLKKAEDLYRNSPSEYTSDYVKALIKTNVTATVAANAINLAAITDYNHTLAVKCVTRDSKFTATLDNLILSNSTTRIVLTRPSALRTGEQVVLAGISLAGTYYVKQFSETTYGLYTDAALLTPAYDGVPYDNAGTVQRLVSRYGMPYQSEDKIGVLATPNIYYPKWQESTTLLNLYAGNNTITSAILDYITKVTVLIDVTDVAVDLTATYPQPFLYMVLDKSAELFAEETRDPNLFQTSNVEQQQNK